jgi:hypothetical protein
MPGPETTRLADLLQCGHLPPKSGHGVPRRMRLEDARILETVLACSLLHLYDSPWLQQSWNTDNISIFSRQDARSQLDMWRPHVFCVIGQPPTGNMAEYEDIVAFGILMMEIEAKQKAEPTDLDIDWRTHEVSSELILDRILLEWRGDVDAGYRKVGQDCLNFRNLVKQFDDLNLAGESGRIAAIYNHIVSPLFKLLRKRFPAASRYFTRLPCSETYSHRLTSARKPERSLMTLFDDSSEQAWHNPE